MKIHTSLSILILSAFSLCLPPTAIGQPSTDLLIKNGRIIDGAGNSWFYGDVAVQDGKILRVGNLQNWTAKKTIDAKGMAVVPGFIDVHAHIETGIFERPTADNFVYDGVTTVVTGNCGNSADDLSIFFTRIDSMKTSINIASLAGHNTIKRLGMGLSNRIPTTEEKARMEMLTEQAMKDGAVGLSTGLIYLPGMYSKTEEIVSLAKIAKQYNGVYATHMRNEGSKVTEAIEETLTIGRQSGIPVQISHFKLSGRANWGKSNITLAMVEKARREGIEVTIDQYPYTAGSTNLAVLVPDWSLEGGLDSLRKRIEDPVIKKKIIDDMAFNTIEGKNKNFEYAVVAMYAPDTSFNGKNISEINQLKGRKKKLRYESETILDMLKVGNAQMIYHTINENDLQYFIKYPYNMPAADAGVSNGKGMPHPRGYGTNARVLGRYVRELKLIELEDAIRRMTSLPAQKFGLNNKGLLREGFDADIVIFDPATVSDRAEFTNPHQFSVGIPYVVVNGEVVIEDSKHTGARSGKSLRKH